MEFEIKAMILSTLCGKKKKKKTGDVQADSACCCHELSRAMSKVTHERSTCLTFEIIPSL